MAVGVLDTEGKWMVGGTEIYVPSIGIQVNHTNVTSSATGRTESGYMYKEWVRTDIRKVNLKYSYLTGDEVHYMLGLMQGKDFTFTYYDNGIKTLSGYVGEFNYTMYNQAAYSNEGGLYSDISVNVVEN